MTDNLFVITRELAANIAGRAALAATLLIQRDELLAEIVKLRRDLAQAKIALDERANYSLDA